MANKVIIGILVLLVILIGGTGYYSYTLSQQIDELGQQLTTFETEQTARVDTVGDELITLRTETLSSLGTLEDGIGETRDEINTLEGEIGVTQNRITGLEDEIGGVASKVDTLQDGLTGAVAGFSRSVIDASNVYERVIRAIVRISDAQKTTYGSGFIFDTEAHVLTNHHVVEAISPIYVTLYDGRVIKATNIGSCPLSDIAVLKLEDNPDIEPPPLADSSQVRIGEPVAAIGDPFGLRDNLTTGIISQVNRVSGTANLLQFDAAVNPGNSGGPLFNSNGEIIGVVTSRISPILGDGIYWAVSSNKAKRVATALIEYGSFDYPWVGVTVINLTPQTVEDRALETANGTLVTEIDDGGPAQAAGIEVDDIIVSIDGVPIRDSDDLTAYLGEFISPGDIVTIGIIRGTTRLELSIEVGKLQE